MELLLSQGARLTDPDNSNYNCISAALNNNIAFASFVIKKGANVHHRDSKGNTVLINLLHDCSIETIKFCLKHGCDINAVNNEGSNFLLKMIYDASFNTNAKAELLIENGVDVSVINGREQSVLGLYKQSQDEKMLKIIFEAELRAHYVAPVNDFAEPEKSIMGKIFQETTKKFFSYFSSEENIEIIGDNYTIPEELANTF